MLKRDREPEVLLLAGPTASGKSALALALAERLGATVVNADSMQVYRDLRVLSARPSPEEEGAAPHRLYGHVDGAEGYSVGRWLADVLPVLAEPGPKLVVGGTGLYFRALTQGLADVPAVAEAERDLQAACLAEVGEGAFRLALRAVDAEAEARIAPGDRQRLVRAAAVHAATGRALSDWRRNTKPAISRWRALVLEPPRETLYARCDRRLEAMMRNGGVEEVEALLARSLPPDRPVLKALGVGEITAMLLGRMSPGEALAAGQISTRRFAKRQLTWFRNQTSNWPRVEVPDPALAWSTLNAPDQDERGRFLRKSAP